MKGESVDVIIHNANVHTMNANGDVFEAVAIRDGKIVEVGPERQILNKYSAGEYIDAQKKDVYPGWVDAHGHILSYAKQTLSVNLIGCKSYEEMIIRIEKYQSKYNRKFIIGRGWDQSMWKDDKMPTNEILNEKFPDIAVCLFRIDGHALLANEFLMKKSDVWNKVQNDTELSEGGYFVMSEPEPIMEMSRVEPFMSIPEPTGVMVDNAMNPIIEILPEFEKKELKDAILEVQHELLMYGITGVHEAGMNRAEFKMMDRLVSQRDLKINIYGMLLPSDENIAFARKNGFYRNKNLYVRSFKVFGDGALGSRGAFLKHSYADKHDHSGYLTTSLPHMRLIAEICHETGYQMNTHAIGDSTNKLMLGIYQEAIEVNPNHRWRIEHAQIVDPKDFVLFAQSGAYASVQPTHATSDQRWAEDRIGSERMEGAYAFKSILANTGRLAIGTDFPVEYIDPFRTIHSAVNRKNVDNEPSNGFLANESITLEECIKGMTIWAAEASFQENSLGTIEEGKDATLSIFEDPVVANGNYTQNFAYMVYIKGKKVYSVE
ncbi:MAG: putative amidohydrolase YtcJ [Salibacteraceae bacterium]|jgi:predicted amidohydrolase YtcJ